MPADEPLASGREAFERMAWRDAYQRLSEADRDRRLGAEDLDRLARAAYLIGRYEEAGESWERTHRSYLDRGEVPRAVRCAFWLGLTLLQRGEHARGGGWMGRAHRLLEESSLDCVERGYLQVPAGVQALGTDPEAAHGTFVAVTETADRFGDSDLRALGRLGQGQALVAQGRAADGVAMLDEAMVAITSGEVSALAAGIVYCAMVLACRDIFDVNRVQQWTAALGRWCATQQDLRPYRGQCLVHRSEIMQLRGDWSDAMDEVRQACDHLADPPGDPVTGMAMYQRAELLRLRGAFTDAESAYREASAWGHTVQPGFSLLRLAQGRLADASAAIRRAAAEAEGDVERSKVLAAYAEIALAAGEVDDARAAVDQLDRIAARFQAPYLSAVVGYARGSVLLASGDTESACAALRRAWIAWHRLEAPYETGRVRLRMAQACRRLGDRDTAEMELDAARRVFEQLGAGPALAEVRKLADSPPPTGGLTPREAEVLRLVATGATNREIAETLVISDKTVARHLSNMFTKLGVASRSAATAYAYEHDLV
ncbi:response regulator transcription factor [Glycomyces xiaoerkulensis]|uniref:response regulator transcription factor n=1 Tax=Glycomyces xiaoerkulensis TaxID=2038139 RepID=UPI000C25A311|nr:LuxR family transcriptional regulator [Glycomyces xiaoerkulensis]